MSSQISRGNFQNSYEYPDFWLTCAAYIQRDPGSRALSANVRDATRRSKCGIPQFESQLGVHCRSRLISKPTDGSQPRRFLVIRHQIPTAWRSVSTCEPRPRPKTPAVTKRCNQNDVPFFASSFMLLHDFPVLTLAESEREDNYPHV